MCESLSILNGAFSATLEKGKDGKQEWKYTPHINKIGVMPKKKHDGKERPQFGFIVKAEAEALKSYQLSLKAMTLDIVKYLKQL